MVFPVCAALACGLCVGLYIHAEGNGLIRLVSVPSSTWNALAIFVSPFLSTVLKALK